MASQSSRTLESLNGLPVNTYNALNGYESNARRSFGLVTKVYLSRIRPHKSKSHKLNAECKNHARQRMAARSQNVKLFLLYVLMSFPDHSEFPRAQNECDREDQESDFGINGLIKL